METAKAVDDERIKFTASIKKLKQDKRKLDEEIVTYKKEAVEYKRKLKEASCFRGAI